MKRWGGLLVCLLLSAIIWVVHNLSQTFSQTVNVPVLISSDIDGRSQYSLSSVVIAAQCTASGYDLLYLNAKRKETDVFIDSKDLIHKEGDVFLIPASTIMKYSDRIFGADVKVDVILGDSFDIKFPVENHIKVPVSLTTRLTYQSQYMLRDKITTVPDSVVVYGNPEILREITSIRTDEVRKMNLSADTHGTARLEVPVGLRVSAKTVEYSIPVSRYVNLNSQIEITFRNKPDDKNMIIIPPKVKFSMKSEFPVSGNPMNNVSVYVDYNDYLNSPTGRCPVLCDGLSESVIEYNIEPDFCNCIEKVQ